VPAPLRQWCATSAEASGLHVAESAVWFSLQHAQQADACTQCSLHMVATQHCYLSCALSLRVWHATGAPDSLLYLLLGCITSLSPQCYVRQVMLY